MFKKFLTGYATMALFAAGASSQGGGPDLQAEASDAQDNLPEITKENAIQIINSRKLLPEPGKYTVKVTNVTPFQRPDSEILINIVNYAAMTPWQLGEAKRLFKEGDYQECTNQNLSSSQRIGMDYTPMKGEIVDIVIDIVPTKNRPEGALLVIGVQPLRNKQASIIRFGLDDMEDTETNRPNPADPASVAELNRQRSINRAQQRGAEAEKAEPSLVGNTENAPAL